jgi:hypothetical protein
VRAEAFNPKIEPGLKANARYCVVLLPKDGLAVLPLLTRAYVLSRALARNSQFDCRQRRFCHHCIGICLTLVISEAAATQAHSHSEVRFALRGASHHIPDPECNSPGLWSSKVRSRAAGWLDEVSTQNQNWPPTFPGCLWTLACLCESGTYLKGIASHATSTVGEKWK